MLELLATRQRRLEQALVGTPVENVDQPIEVLRVVHSVDPCLDCATHVIRPGGAARVFELWRPPGAEVCI